MITRSLVLTSLIFTLPCVLRNTAYAAPQAQSPPLSKRSLHIPVVKRFNQTKVNTGESTIPDLDSQRLSALFSSKAKKRAPDGLNEESISSLDKRQTTFSDLLTDYIVAFTIPVSFGYVDQAHSSPANPDNVVVDNSLGLTWIKASNYTTASGIEGPTFELSSGLTGTLYTDDLAIPNANVPNPITGQEFGVVTAASGSYSGFDGALGLASSCTLEANGDSTIIPTFMFNLAQSNSISNVFALALNTNDGSSTVGIQNGEIVFGGGDENLFDTSSLTTVNIAQITSLPEAGLWTIQAATISYGSAVASQQALEFLGPSFIPRRFHKSTSNTLLSAATGVFDTGTTLLLLPSSAYGRYVTLTGARSDRRTGLLKISSTQYSNLQSLIFTFGSTAYEFVPNAQIWPRSLNTAIGGSADSIYLIISQLPSDMPSDIQFVAGSVFLERFYTVYDSTANTIGIANTDATSSTTIN